VSESNWRERTVWGGFAESVARDPAALAVVCADDEATYGQLADLATRAAAGFLRLGVQKGDKIAFWTPNCVAFLGAFLGAARIGAVAVPMNTRFRSDEAGYVLGQSDSVGALVANAGGSTDAMAMLRELCPGIADRNGAELSCQQLPRLKWVVSLDSAEPGFIHWADVVRPLDAVDEAGISSAEAAVTPNHTVVIQYTSGSTAFPKGAMLTHNGITRNAWQFGEAVRQKPGEAQLGPLPFFHVGGLVTAALANLLHGSLLVTMRHFDPDETLRLIEKYRCTLISGVETIYLRLLDHPKLGEHDLSSLDRCVALGTGEFIRRVHDQLGVSSVSTLYGLSEASPNITIVRAGEPLEVSMRTMGRPQPGVTVEIRDPETNESVPPGEHGEICVHGWALWTSKEISSFSDASRTSSGSAVRTSRPRRLNAFSRRTRQ
jgi:fatty-acyl-CoA synthase